MRDPINWESTVSELEFAVELKKLGFSVEFAQQRKGSPSTDIKTEFLGEEIYFEVKLLAETDEASRVYREIWATHSDLIVEIIHEKSLDVERFVEKLADDPERVLLLPGKDIGADGRPLSGFSVRVILGQML